MKLRPLALSLAVLVALAAAASSQTPPPARPAGALPAATPAPMSAPSPAPDVASPAPRARVRTPRPVAEGGYLGVELLDLTPELREHFAAPRDQGVLVARVVAGSPAAKAGLEVGDVVVAVGEQKVHDSWELSSEIWRRGEGESLSLGLVRDRRPQKVQATVERRVREGVDVGRWIFPPAPDGPPLPGAPPAPQAMRPRTPLPVPPELGPALERLGRLLEDDDVLRRMDEARSRVDSELELRLKELEQRLRELEERLRRESESR